MKKPKAGGGYKGKGFNGLSKLQAEGPKAARAARAPERPANPFERKPTSKKHEVLGRVRGDKAAAKSVARARSEAWETRKKTLGVEARQDGKSNSFLDRRFGEQDDVTEEDKMLMRFQRERMARIKKGAFDLDEDEEDILTHKGQSLGAMTKDDFSDFSSDDEAGVNAADTKSFNFGGGFVQADDEGAEGEARRKTKKEVMEEIIAKSKMHKMMRKREKAEDEDFLNELNFKFKSLEGMLAQHRRPTNADKKAQRDARRAEDGEEEDGEEEVVSKKEKRLKRKAEELEAAEAEDGEVDEYDKLAAELASDLKARAVDRLKSAEELAKEEHERLVAAEKARVRRMRGEVDSDEELDEEGKVGGYKKRRVRFSDEGERRSLWCKRRTAGRHPAQQGSDRALESVRVHAAGAVRVRVRVRVR